MRIEPEQPEPEILPVRLLHPGDHPDQVAAGAPKQHRRGVSLDCVNDAGGDFGVEPPQIDDRVSIQLGRIERWLGDQFDLSSDTRKLIDDPACKVSIGGSGQPGITFPFWRSAIDRVQRNKMKMTHSGLLPANAKPHARFRSLSYIRGNTGRVRDQWLT